MYNISKVAAVIITVALTITALVAKTVEQSYIEAHVGRTDIPVPIEVVAPQARLSSMDDAVTVHLAFVVDESGRPTDITVVSSTDAAVAASAKEAVAKWRFDPVKRNGEPIATKVVLPVRFLAADNPEPVR